MKTTIPTLDVNWGRSIPAFVLLLAVDIIPLQANSIEAIPTLGGMNASATGINNSGSVSGFSSLAGEMAQHGYLYSNGTIIDLGTLGGNFGFASGLNNVNQVIGDSGTAGGAEFHAFRYDNGTTLDLGTLGGTMSTASDINDGGMVVGSAYVLANLESHAFLFDGNSMLDLGTLGGNSSGASAINIVGDVVGDSYTAGNMEIHPFLFQGGTMIDLGTLGGSPAFATDINDSGVIVGESRTGTMETHAFLSIGGNMLDLGTLGGTWSTAYQVNEQGVVVGDSSLAGNMEFHGFVFAGGVMTDLGTLGGGFTTVHDLNNNGQIVGDSEDATLMTYPFLWENGLMIDLNTLLPPNSGWELWSAQYINDAGQIVGFGLFNGAFSWFFLTLSSSNTSPIAEAGPNQNHQCAGWVTLDAGGSSDPDGEVLHFEWMENNNLLATGVMPAVNLSTGSHVIVLRVTDPQGAMSEDTVLITVLDTVVPSITCPEPVVVGANNENVAPLPDFRKSIVALDNCTAPDLLTVQQDPAPGTLLEIGFYEVVVSVADESGNTSQCTTSFGVEDRSSPQLTCPKPMVLTANKEGWVEVPNILDQVEVFDNWTPVDQIALVQRPEPGTLVQVGDHELVVAASDEAGNISSCVTQLLVEEPKCIPEIQSVNASPNTIAKANRKWVPITLSVVIAPGCDTSVKSEILEVSSNEPIIGKGDNTSQDWEITGPLSLNVRAEYSVKGNGRVYTILVQSWDELGNKSVHQAEVHVTQNRNAK